MNRIMTRIGAAALCLGIAGTAHAATNIIGGGDAENCYEAAKLPQPGAIALAPCNRALAEESLTQRDRAATLVNRGIIRMRLGQFDDAIKDYRAAIRLQSDLGDSYINLALALVHTRQEEAALAALNRGLSLNPSNASVGYYTRGTVHELLGNVPAAFADYQRAAELAPDWAEPRAQLSRFRIISRPRMTA
ncbi:tetratricopeptide repeat protein [Parapedomonas caeni]